MSIRLTPAQSLAIRDLDKDNALQTWVHGRTLDSLEAKGLIYRFELDTRYYKRYFLTELGKQVQVKELHKQALKDTDEARAKAVPVATAVTTALLEDDQETIERIAAHVTAQQRVFHINDKVVDRHDGSVGTVESRYSDGRVGISLAKGGGVRVVPMSRLDPLAEFHQTYVAMNSREFPLIPHGTVFEVQGSRYNAVTGDWGVQLYSSSLDRTLQAISRESLEQYFKAV